jgi:choice-of-anchor C domain-containing protein
MKIRKTTAEIVTAILLGCSMSAMQAQGVLNGSFEMGTDPNASPGQNIGMTAPDSTTISGWTLSSGTIDYIGSRWVAADGGRCIDLSGTSAGSVFQTINGFTPGLAYQVRFFIAANPEGGPPTRSLQADIGSASQVFSFTGPGTVSDLAWAERTFDFTATATTLTLTFASLDNDAFGAVLDGVHIVPVPEPSAWALLVMGASVLIYRKRRPTR